MTDFRQLLFSTTESFLFLTILLAKIALYKCHYYYYYYYYYYNIINNNNYYYYNYYYYYCYKKCS